MSENDGGGDVSQYDFISTPQSMYEILLYDINSLRNPQIPVKVRCDIYQNVIITLGSELHRKAVEDGDLKTVLKWEYNKLRDRLPKLRTPKEVSVDFFESWDDEDGNIDSTTDRIRYAVDIQEYCWVEYLEGLKKEYAEAYYDAVSYGIISIEKIVVKDKKFSLM